MDTYIEIYYANYYIQACKKLDVIVTKQDKQHTHTPVTHTYNIQGNHIIRTSRFVSKLV